MNVWKHLQPQIAEHINDLHAWGYTFVEIEEALQEKECWTLSPMFSTIEFNYEHAGFTLTALCNLYELITGKVDTAFNEELRQNVLKLMEEKRDAYYDDMMDDLMRGEHDAPLRFGGTISRPA